MKLLIVLGVVALCGAVYGETKCQRHRREAQELGGQELVPECDDNGDYSAMQCYKEQRRGCMCYHVDGTVIAGPSRTLEACHCPRHRYVERMRRLIGNYIPQCDDTTGHYSATQCHGSTGYCWCVDKQGHKLPGNNIECLKD
ncbi:NID2 [Cordylochernes scorpioides]|uniref:NID2 n=1 Tax=Cordylochernes scorpioides TaxID=51811 RepID=A0ABY6K398_9ARAC|nr:NID2 [Cordylochernes scorpioides]